jgi:hypothetical protein
MASNFKHPVPNPQFERLVESVKENKEQDAEELYFDPVSGRLVVSRGTPTNAKTAVAAGALAREGFFGAPEPGRKKCSGP